MPQDEEKQLGPERDALEVGLARHEKKRGVVLPPWLEEYGGWIAAVVLILAVVVPIELLGIFDAVEVFVPTASLRTVGPLQKRWAEGSSTQINWVAIEVENLGPEPARDISVQARWRLGSGALAGPAALEPGKRGRFGGQVSITLRDNEAIDVQLACSNCPAPPMPGQAAPQ